MATLRKLAFRSLRIGDTGFDEVETAVPGRTGFPDHRSGSRARSHGHELTDLCSLSFY